MTTNSPAKKYLSQSNKRDFILFTLKVSSYLKKQMPEAAKAGVKDLPDQDKLVEEIFQHEDQDKNGFISHQEFSGPKHDELWPDDHLTSYVIHAIRRLSAFSQQTSLPSSQSTSQSTQYLRHESWQ